MLLRPWQRSSSISNIAKLLLIFGLSGCATVFAPADKETVDIRDIHRGMSRVEVERRLGRATLDVRPELGSDAARKREYRYFERVQVSDDASSIDTVKNKMIGFRDHGVTIYFDTSDRVMSVHPKKQAEARL